MSVRDPIILGDADRDRQDVHVDVEVGSEVGVDVADNEDSIVRDGVDDPDTDRVRGRVIDADDDDVALRVRKGPRVSVDDDDEDHDSRDERVGVRVDVPDRLAVGVAERDRV